MNQKFLGLPGRDALRHFIEEDGWIKPRFGDWRWVSSDAPVYVLDIPNGDADNINVGHRIKCFTSGLDTYGIVVAKGTPAGPVTPVTVYTGTGVGVGGNNIFLDLAYSSVKYPLGFPASPASWTVLVTDTNNASQSNPTASTWYNLGSISISIPIGTWDIYYHCINELTITPAAVQAYAMRCTLSTSSNSESDSGLTSSQGGTLPVMTGAIARFIQVRNKYTLSLAAKTTYYLNSFWGAGTATSLNFRGDLAPTRIMAVCAYL